MDPNANLQEQERILIAHEGGLLDTDDRRELALLRADLRDWLDLGGFQPDWAKAPRAARYYGRA